MQYLNEQVPSQWIGRDGPQHYAPWSLYLTLLDLHVWGDMKNMM
jgi:hypothetical protein